MSSSSLAGAVLAAAISLFSVLTPDVALAHGDGSDHAHPTAAPPPVAPAADPGFAADGDLFQAVLTLGDGGMLLYLADLDSNAPVAQAAIQIETAAWQGTAQPTNADGIYRIDWTPPQTGSDVTVMVSAHGHDDLILIRVPAPSAPATSAAVDATHWTHWTGGMVIGVLLALVMASVARRRGRTQPTTRLTASMWTSLALASTLLPTSALAHGGEDHGTPAPEAAQVQMGQDVVMDKASQFMLGIRTQRIRPQDAADTVRVMGRVIPDPSAHARLHPSQPARVLSDPSHAIPVPGQSVTRGQVVAVLEPLISTLERGDKRATLSRVESDLDMTERDLARQIALGGLVPAKQLETTRIRLDQLRKERDQITGTALGRELLRAPLDGIVTDVHLVPGEVVTTTQALVEITNPDHVRVEAIIHDLPLARRISAATATSNLLPGQDFALTLLGVSPRLDPVDQGVHALFSVTSPQIRDLHIGMPVDIFLATGATRLRMAVPRAAIAERGGRQVVFVRTAPERFAMRPVRVTRMVGALAEIADGVMPGDLVVVQGVGQMAVGR